MPKCCCPLHTRLVLIFVLRLLLLVWPTVPHRACWQTVCCIIAPQVQRVKVPLLEKAADALRTDPKFEGLRAEAAEFRSANPWVEDSALFYCLANFEEGLKGKAWWLWPEPIRWDDRS